MGFDSDFGGRPVVLIDLSYEIGADIYYAGATSAERELSRQGYAGVYEPIPIDLGSFSVGIVGSETLTMRLPRDSNIGRLVWPDIPQAPMSIAVSLGDLADDISEWPLPLRRLFIGGVSGVSVNAEGELELTLTPAITSAADGELMRTFGHNCGHVLFGPKCGLSREAHTHTATVSIVERSSLDSLSWGSGNRVSFELPDARPREAFIGGTISWTHEGQPRSVPIYDAAIDEIAPGVYQYVLTLPSAPDGLAPGVEVKVTQGCPRSLGGCRDIYQNVLNFGGFPWVPYKNPIGKLMIGR